MKAEIRRPRSIHEKLLILITAFCTFLGGSFAAGGRMDLAISLLMIPLTGWLLAFVLKIGTR
jgi:hypothetical protein